MTEEPIRDPETQIGDRIALFSWLEMIQRSFDPKLFMARQRFNEAVGWVGIWLIRSLIGTSYKKMPEESLNKTIGFLSTQWQTWGTYLLAVGITSSAAAVDFKIPIFSYILGYGLVLVSLIASLYANLNRMLTLDDPYFNSNAYKLFRRQEYFMFITYFRENSYTVETAVNMVKLWYRENSLESIVTEHRANNLQLQSRAEELRKNLREKEEALQQSKEVETSLVQHIRELDRLAKVLENGFNSAISTIYRLRSSDTLFCIYDLRVVTDFSLFEYKAPLLLRLAELGTTETPDVIDVGDADYAHYSSVRLVQGFETIEYATSDREGRTVASYWIDMPSGRTLIYNFHYDSTIEHMDVIIEMKEMYRYIKGICIHLDERGLLRREGLNNVAN